MIEINQLAKDFPLGGSLRRLLRRSAASFHVLRGVDLSVESGDFLALLGLNGAGKTTILKTIATLLRPDNGTVSVCGFDVTTHAREVRGRIGYVLADERSFHWRLTVRENLEFFAALGGIKGDPARSRIAYLLERLDLHHSESTRFAALSTGMKQRLAVGRALLTHPKVLLMDEPTRSIDSSHATEVWRLVRDEVSETHGCVVLVTHNIQEALALCNRVAILSDGNIVCDMPTQDLSKLSSDLGGFSVAVQGLSARDLKALAEFPGVRDIRVASQLAGEQTLEVWTTEGDISLAGFIAELTDRGGSICSLQRSTPLQGILERLLVREIDISTAGVLA